MLECTFQENGRRSAYVLTLFEQLTKAATSAGSQVSVAVYTHHFHAVSLVRKIILRIKSWENYVFFLSEFNVGH